MGAWEAEWEEVWEEVWALEVVHSMMGEESMHLNIISSTINSNIRVVEVNGISLVVT